jgi:hypothetical protein
MVARLPAGWSARDKFGAVVETAALNEAELAAYCRERGLYPEQIRHWREACEQANDWDTRAEPASSRRRANRIRSASKSLERQLRHKEKALAETAALLVLTKKAEAIWGEAEDE